MAFSEKPPMLRGSTQEQVNALRDYLFRLAQSLDPAANTPEDVQIVRRKDGTSAVSKKTEAEKTAEAVRKQAQELRALIIKTANEVIQYADSKVEEYNSLYVAKSDFGTFEESISARIESTARGVVESYRYGAAIDSMQEGIGLLQSYYTAIDGEIRRGIVIDPDTGEYVTGIAISQSLRFSGECGPTDVNNPGDGYTYYYLTEGQTFGLYTSTGWQFWIDGYKKGWFSATDGMLHVANVVIEETLQIGGYWKIRTAPDGSEFEILYSGEAQ